MKLCSVYRCKEGATIPVPTGYGAMDEMCAPHATEWAASHWLHFVRMKAFYSLLGFGGGASE